jgi:energy-coupling factor transporter transmembrane protein EcfT
VFQDLYLDQRSPVHGLDPRAKIIGAVVLSGLPFVFNDPVYVGSVGVAVVSLAAVGGCLRNLFRFRYLYLLFFTVNFLLWQAYVSGGETLVRLGPIHLTHDGLLYGLAAATRFDIVLVVGVLFVSCTKPEDLTVGLIKLRLPYPVAFVVSTTVRLVPTFVGAAGTMIEAQTARGLRVDSRNPIKRARQLLPVAIPLIMYAMRHASLMSLALEARGFSPSAPRTSYANPILTRSDLAVLVILLATLTGCLVLRFAGYGAVIPGRV